MFYDKINMHQWQKTVPPSQMTISTEVSATHKSVLNSHAEQIKWKTHLSHTAYIILSIYTVYVQVMVELYINFYMTFVSLCFINMIFQHSAIRHWTGLLQASYSAIRHLITDNWWLTHLLIVLLYILFKVIILLIICVA